MGVRRMKKSYCWCFAGMLQTGLIMPVAGQYPFFTPPPQPAPVPSAAVPFACVFTSTPQACGFAVQAKSAARVSVLSVGGINGVKLTTQPGDTRVAGSDVAERNDLQLTHHLTGCFQGSDQWWAHSVMFPDDYNPPPPATPDNWTW